MTGVNPDNERIKRRYFHHMREAKGLTEATIGHASRAIAGYERLTNWKPFSRFNSEDAVAFKRSLLAGRGKQSAELHSRATIYSKLNHQDVPPGHSSLQVIGLGNSHWKTADPVRSICRRAFERAGIVYFSPHSFRRTLALLAEERCRTPAELKAWSQNLGHDQLLTTLTSYGRLPDTRQAELVAGLTERQGTSLSPERLLTMFLDQLKSPVPVNNEEERR